MNTRINTQKPKHHRHFFNTCAQNKTASRAPQGLLCHWPRFLSVQQATERLTCHPTDPSEPENLVFYLQLPGPSRNLPLGVTNHIMGPFGAVATPGPVDGSPQQHRHQPDPQHQETAPVLRAVARWHSLYTKPSVSLTKRLRQRHPVRI